MRQLDKVIEMFIDRRELPLSPLPKHPQKRLIVFPAESVGFRGLPIPVWKSVCAVFNLGPPETMLVSSEDLEDCEIPVASFEQLESTLRGLGPGRFLVRASSIRWMFFSELDSAMLIADADWFRQVSQRLASETGLDLVELALAQWCADPSSAFGRRLREAASGPG